jgi:2-methylisocitrate lyase-like PEP mutase family enzyme
MTAHPIETFRALHQMGCFVLPNPWDTGSAVLLHHLGFHALATTSAGMAFSRGLPDSVTAVGCEEMLAHVAELVKATPLPVNADFQNGYAHEPEGVASNVTRCLATGVAGLSIEDASGDPARPLYPADLALERVRAARAAVDASGTNALLTARCEAFLVGDADAERTVRERLVAFAAAGADCLFAPGVRDLQLIARLVNDVAPRPLNVLMSAPVPGLSVARLADLGVRRISVGSALSRVAWGAFLRAARSLAEHGSFDGLAEAATFAELNQLFEPTGQAAVARMGTQMTRQRTMPEE